MGRRLGIWLIGSAAVLAAVASAGPRAAASAAALANRAAASPGWRLAATFGEPGAGRVLAVATSGAGDAWATGQWINPACSCQELLTARWDGHSWQEPNPPPPFALTGRETSTGTAGAALSTSYSWIFLTRLPLSGRGSEQDWALQWKDGQWQPFQLADASQINSAVVFSRANAWGFGGHLEEPYAIHFNGRTWRRVPIPVDPQDPEAVAAPGTHNIWAVGPVGPLQNFSTPFGLAHWNGRHWRTIYFPNLTGSPHGEGAFYAEVVPDSSAGAWVIAVTRGHNYLLRWTGRRWVHVKMPFQIVEVGPMARDGYGGLWIGATILNGGSFILHYSSAGTWSKTVVPVTHEVIDSMRLIPGTRSLWAGAEGDQGAVMLKYGR